MRKNKVMPTAPEAPQLAPLDDLPGYYIRRLQQIAVALFLEETQAQGITPVQFAALSAAYRQPGLDQRSLAASIGFDTSTIGGVIDRLEQKGLVERVVSAQDRRARQLRLTAAGAQLLAACRPVVEALQAEILAPLSAAERKSLLALARKALGLG